MDIEEFYAGDERRRHSAEIEIGTVWTDDEGIDCALNWVEGTGELYFMREPQPGIIEDPLGDMVTTRQPVSAIEVWILGTIATHDEVQRILQGWQEAMSAEHSVTWVTGQLAAAGIAAPPVSGF